MTRAQVPDRGRRQQASKQQDSKCVRREDNRLPAAAGGGQGQEITSICRTAGEKFAEQAPAQAGGGPFGSSAMA